MRRGRKFGPSWMSQQTCWNCRKTGHLCQKCTASQTKRQAYKDMKYGECTDMSAQVTTEPEVYMATIEDAAHSTSHDEPQDGRPRIWPIDPGCTSHLSPNISDFVSYTPYKVPQTIQMGDGTPTPSLSEGIMLLKCIVNGKIVKHQFQNVQNVPGLMNRLLSCKTLDQCRLHMKISNGI